MTQPQVSALGAEASRGYRRAWAAERLADSFWVIPALFLVAGAGLAAVTVNARSLGVPVALRVGPPVNPGEAASVLGIVATSTLTFLGVVFTLTLVALQLASSQLSPRVLRMFVRSGVTKVAFGILLATFSFSVAFLVLEGGHGTEADSRGVAVVMVLVSASLIVFIGYVAKTMKLLQVSWVITGVADLTRKAVSRYFPLPEAYLPADAPVLSGQAVTIRLPARRRKTLGVLQGVDHRRLAELARRHDCVFELLARVGEYVPTQGAIVAVHGPPPPSGQAPASQVLASINVGRSRTLYQDPAFGLRQLVDIAIQALSPAVNQPTTATQVIDRIEDILLRIAARPALTGYFADSTGRIRLTQPVTGWDELLDLAFTEITDYGSRSTQVVRRLLAAYAVLEHAAGPGRRPGLQQRRTRLLAEAASHGIQRRDARADALGLG
ncbi:MAG: DUF2254 domain-containing protein [Streptosporangiaceae bacterium]